MSKGDREQHIREHWERAAYREAADAGIRAYGPEIVSYLLALCHSETDAGDAFSSFAEDLWRALPDFRWQCEFRSWTYTLARNALFRLARDPYRRRAYPLGDSPAVLELAAQVRTTTLQYLRTETKDRIAALRGQLDARDQELLILRVDRKLAWRDVARIMCADALPEDGDHEQLLAREASKLRKRFERAKQTLRALLDQASQRPDG